MPSKASESVLSLGLTDDVDASFFDQLGKGLDDGVLHGTERSSVCREFELKFKDASDTSNDFRGLDSQKEQQLLSTLNNAMEKLEVSQNGPDLIVPSMPEEPTSSCLFLPLLDPSEKLLSVMEPIPTTEGADKPSTQVTEVDWSNFKPAFESSNQGGFGSFSDLFSEADAVPVNPPSPWTLEADPPFAATFQSKALETNIHQCMTQGNMVDVETTQSFSVGQTQHAEIAQAATYCQVIQPLLSNSISLGTDASIVHGSTTEYATVTDSSAVLLSAPVLNQRQSLETYTQQNEGWEQYAAGDSGNQPSMYYDPQYPGWCFNFQTQEWSEIPGYFYQEQMDVSSNTGTSSQLDMAVKEDYNQRETVQLSDGYPANNSQTYYGAYSPQAESLVVDKQHDSNLKPKEDIYNSIMEERPTSGSGNIMYPATGGLPWIAASPSAQNWQTEGVETSDKEINSRNSVFSYTYETSPLSQPLQVTTTGEQGFGFNSKRSTGAYDGAMPSSYISQFPTYSAHALSQSVAHAAPKSIHEALKSSAGRPSFLNVSFGFGGRVVIVRPNDMSKFGTIVGEQSFVNENPRTCGSIEIHKLSQVVTHGSDYGGPCASNFSFATLGSEVISGPLLSGSQSHKDILKWIDERISICETERSQSRNLESFNLLWELLKVACQHYGKLRSGPGTIGIGSQADNSPEAALAKLLEPKKSEPAWAEYSLGTSSADCLNSLPMEPQLQATAYEMKKLLLSGKQKEALQCAQQGQFWGPALVLARQLGEKPYADTVAEMARHQFRAGSPLQVLNLLLVGQAHKAFAGTITPPSCKPFAMENAAETPLGGPVQDAVDGLLQHWQENLAIMAANRTNGDEQVIMHLGDCLWERRGEVAAAHTCYLIADANFESFSSNSRLCLVGADHHKFPRTFASPEAIQRTELYEYSKVMGNPQFVLVPLQPYKLVYVSMLAEVGKVAEALRYCLAVLKLLKSAGRTSEVEFHRQVASDLEERLRIHSQAGNISNLGPAKLMGRFLSTLDKSIHRIMGASSPPKYPENMSTTASDPNVGLMEAVGQPTYRSLKTNMPSLVPSASMEPICSPRSTQGWTTAPARSVSEPDFSKGAKTEISQDGNLEKKSSYLGRFGSQLAKAAGFMAKLNAKEAKLGEKNKFFYDENLKRWVEEGVDLPAEEAVLPPPPTIFKQTSQEEFDIQHVRNSSPEVPPSGRSGSHMSSLGTPPIPPSSNQFSARARSQGVRSRYVDTFNKAENVVPSRALQSPLPPLMKSGGKAPAQFFVPAYSPAIESDESVRDQVANGSSNNLFGLTENSKAPESFSAATATAYDLNGHLHHTEDPNLTSSTLNFSTPVEKPMKRASSAGNTNSIGNSFSDNDNVSTGTSAVSQSKTHVPNGVHSRAASWSDYPVSYGVGIESNMDMYTHQLETFEAKNPMKRLFFPTTDAASSIGLNSSDNHSKPFTGIIASSSLPPPPLLDLSTGGFISGGSAVDVVGSLHRSSAPKGAFDINTTADDLQDVEL